MKRREFLLRCVFSRELIYTIYIIWSIGAIQKMTIGRFGLRRRNYDFPPYRPPSEANSLLLRVTRGCPWNRCTFCSMYKGMKFEIRELEKIKYDISMAKEFYGEMVKTVFIGDSDSLILKTDTLVEILNFLLMRKKSQKFPGEISKNSKASLPDQ